MDWNCFGFLVQHLLEAIACFILDLKSLQLGVSTIWIPDKMSSSIYLYILNNERINNLYNREVMEKGTRRGREENTIQNPVKENMA